MILGTVDESESLTLDKIRDNLIRQEDTIIFSLIERAQFRLNPAAYDPKSNSVPGFDGSLLDYLLRETEHLHAKVGPLPVVGLDFWSARCWNRFVTRWPLIAPQ